MITALYDISAEGARKPLSKIRVCEEIDADCQKELLKEFESLTQPRCVNDILGDLIGPQKSQVELARTKLTTLRDCIALLLETPVCKDAIATTSSTTGDESKTLPSKDKEGGKTVSFQ